MTIHLDVELTADVRPPVTDPTLGIGLRSRPAAGPWAHRLVTVGDSLTHGFQHFAIFNTGWSWPSIVARQLGDDRFRYPVISGPGGHPLNLERVARLLRANPLAEVIRIREFMDSVERYYETGQGAAYPPQAGPANDNLGIWGWDLRDTLVRTAVSEAALIGPPRDKVIPMVNDSGHRAAVAVLNASRAPDGRALTPLEAARQLGDDPGGIETLCVWLGANNVLGAVTTLKIALSGPGYQDLTTKSAYNVWRIQDFTTELRLVADEVRLVNAEHVLWATVPHVTIPPITRGLGEPLAGCHRYFSYYGRPWETGKSFDPGADAHLTGTDAWALDVIIDGYNRAIESVVAQARADGFDWRIVDMCAVLDRLAYRRNVELGAMPPGWDPYPLPAVYGGLDTRFFTTDDQGKVTAGGLIGLDGIHPTTAGYGIVAQEFVNVMASAGVRFANGTAIDFADVLRNDSLHASPPARIGDALSLIAKLEDDVQIIERLNPLK
jgi:hypothetical protein